LEVSPVSISLIQQYYTKLERTVKFGKSFNEQSIRDHFLNVLNNFAKAYDNEVVPELNCMGTRGRKVKPDGILKNSFSLDQYKEKKPKDPTIAEKFNNYRFADHKTKVIDLLKRVTTVSVETMKIIGEMKGKD